MLLHGEKHIYETYTKSTAIPKALDCVLKGHQELKQQISPSHGLFTLGHSSVQPEFQTSASMSWLSSLSLLVTLSEYDHHCPAFMQFLSDGPQQR